MEIIAAKIKRYSIPLARRLTLKTESIKDRKGALLFLTDSNGNTACGELAPLEGLHNESLEDAISQLTHIKDSIIGIFEDEPFENFTEQIAPLMDTHIYPSVTCAIEIAIVNLLKQRGMFNYLGNIAIPVNALLTADNKELAAKTVELVSQGFTSIKVKVARTNLNDEIAAIDQLAKIVAGKATLRLDANRQWSVDQALEFCNRIASPAIEYIEEPLADTNQIQHFTSKSNIPIALDETLVEKDLRTVKQYKNIAAYILKPSVIGGLYRTAELIRHAKQNNIKPVLSSAFETSVSLKTYALFAGIMNLQNIPHGLDTLKFFSGDISDKPLKIANGQIDLSGIISTKTGKPESPKLSEIGSESIKSISKKLLDAGITKGERVAILSENSTDHAAVILGLWNIGATAVPLSTRYTPQQIHEAIETLSCKKIFVSDSYSNCRLGCVDTVLKIKDFADLNSNRIGEMNFEDFNFDLNSDASIIFTSASTAKPKAILHTIANHYYSALGSNENIPFQDGDAWLMSLPMYHISGFSLLMRTLTNKASIISPQPGALLNDAIKEPAITHISLVAAQLSELLESNESITRMKKMKAILIGGSAIPVNLIKRSLEHSLPIFTTYGSTEMASQITTTKPGQLHAKIGSSGKLLPYRELKLTDSSEILVKGKTLFKGYVKKDSIDLPIDGQGYFHTNDTGILDSESNLIVTGRKDLMFISGGENIHPQQIERQIERIPGVDRAIVIPTDDQKFGKVPAAFIKMQNDTPLDPPAIQNELQKHLESFKIPKIIRPWPEKISISIKPDRKSFEKFL